MMRRDPFSLGAADGSVRGLVLPRGMAFDDENTIGKTPNGPALVQRSARHFGAAIARNLVADGANSADSARFADDVEHVAHFMADLSNNLAWQRWCYGALTKSTCRIYVPARAVHPTVGAL
jgi:hypothetical protein